MSVEWNSGKATSLQRRSFNLPEEKPRKVAPSVGVGGGRPVKIVRCRDIPKSHFCPQHATMSSPRSRTDRPARLSRWLVVAVTAAVVRSQNSTEPDEMGNLPKQTMISGWCTASQPQQDCGLHKWELSCPELLQAYYWDPSSACCSFSDTANGGCLLTVGGPGSNCTWRELDSETYFTASMLDDSDSTCPESSYQLKPSESGNVNGGGGDDDINGFSAHGTAAPQTAPAPAPAPSIASSNSYSITTKSGACWATDPTSECGLYEWPSSCSDVLEAYQWSGSCCSFVDTDDGRCTLTVDGPGSECTWSLNGNQYTMYIADSNQHSCPPTKYTVDPSETKWNGPTPAPRITSGSCWTVTPNDECGFMAWSDPCSELVNSFQWEGSCCSLSDTQDGGCLLSVDGPGSDCTWVAGNSEYTIFVAEQNEGTCPDSLYSVTDQTETSRTFGPTPEPVSSGWCGTSHPDDNCGVYTWDEYSCWSVLKRYEFSGSCCSLSSTDGGGCRLTVDGPGSTCSWSAIGRKSVYTVNVDESTEGICPASDYTSVPRKSPFTQCMYDSFGQCLSTCELYPSLRQSFKTCYQQDQTQALQCAAGAIAVCAPESGQAPKYICDIISTMYSVGAMKSELCLELKEKCTSGTGVSDAACS